MEQKSRSKIILEILCKMPCILNIRWSKDYRVFVDVIEETTEAEKENIKKLLLMISDKYEVIFQFTKKKKWWEKILENLKMGNG